MAIKSKFRFKSLKLEVNQVHVVQINAITVSYLCIKCEMLHHHIHFPKCSALYSVLCGQGGQVCDLQLSLGQKGPFGPHFGNSLNYDFT